MVSGMAKERRDEHEGEELTVPKRLEQLYELIDGIEVAMLTTRRPDGSLVSRPMQTQARRAGTDLWFMTSVESGKLDELIAEPQVNLAYYKDATREFVSVSGLAHVTQDRAMIHELYKPDWKAWLGDEGGDRDGGPNDPRIALIEITAQSATYLKSNKPRVVALFQVAKAIATGNPPNAGDLGHLERTALAGGEGRK
jgi:general stress protein 26